jgi:protein gp37
MSEHSRIEWTDATWNPVTGCTKISPGCRNCYAETFAERFRGVPGHPFEQGFDLRLWPARLELPLAWKTPRRVFVNSMGDLFHEGVPDDFIEAVFCTMSQARWHGFQVLTKHAERMASFISRRRRWARMDERFPNIWLGVSVETQRYVERAEILTSVPASVRFLSCEPLLGPLQLKSVLGVHGINWVIVGGESGPRARPVEATWIRGIRDQCVSARVPFFFKQWGGVNKKAAGKVLDGKTWVAVPKQPTIRRPNERVPVCT